MHVDIVEHADVRTIERGMGARLTLEEGRTIRTKYDPVEELALDDWPEEVR